MSVTSWFSKNAKKNIYIEQGRDFQVYNQGRVEEVVRKKKGRTIRDRPFRRSNALMIAQEVLFPTRHN